MHGEMSVVSMWRAPRRGGMLGVLAFAALAVSASAQDRGAVTVAPGAQAGAIDVTAVERRLYDALRRSPRDPAVRAALGEWMASRGQLKAGAVLLEEARLFGGSTVAIAARLQHIYTWMRDWESLAALPGSPLSPGERARAAALVNRPTSAVGPDSTVVPFAPVEFGALGRLPLMLGNDTIWADVDPQAEGVVLPGLRRGAGLVELQGEDQRGPLGVLPAVAVGDLVLHNIPVRVDAALGAGRARLGLDVFAQLAPTVDTRAGTVTLRRAGRVDEPPGAMAIPFLLGFPGVRLALRAGEAPVPMASPAGRAALRGKRWTVDLRRGVVWVESAR
jgi:hypothetical protein